METVRQKLIKELMETLTGTLGIIRPTFEEYPNRCQLQTVVTFIPQIMNIVTIYKI